MVAVLMVEMAMDLTQLVKKLVKTHPPKQEHQIRRPWSLNFLFLIQHRNHRSRTTALVPVKAPAQAAMALALAEARVLIPRLTVLVMVAATNHVSLFYRRLGQYQYAIRVES